MFKDHALLTAHWILIIPFLFQVHNRGYSEKLVHCMMVGVIFTGILGLVYLAGFTEYLGAWAKTSRYAPTSSGVIMSGNLCSLFFTLSLLLYMKKRQKFYIAVCIFSLIATIVSGTKTAIIVLALSVAFLFYDQKWFKDKRLIFVLVMILPFLFFGKGKELTQRFSQDFSSLANKNLLDDSKPLSSLTYRFYTCDVAWKIFKENPIFGTGLGDFFIEKEKYINRGELRDDFRHTLDAHNEYLEALATLGILGFVLLLSIYGSAITNRPNIYVVLIVCSYLVFGLTTPVLKNKWGLLTFMFLLNHFGVNPSKKEFDLDQV
ncbi:MAG: O-antigen ligase family protein [Candidatus Cloacimonetes bacterium]|nr:O-antigen ligase family protein [Candidatus Cloacimonadota bacterium]